MVPVPTNPKPNAMYNLRMMSSFFKGVALIGRSADSLQRLTKQSLVVSVGVVTLSVTAWALHQAWGTYKQLGVVKDLPAQHPAYDPRGKVAAERRRTNRVASKWFRSQGFATPAEHPFVFRAFAELTSTPPGPELRQYCYARFARWFQELPTLRMALRKHLEAEVGAEPQESDFQVRVGKTTRCNRAALQAAWQQWNARYEGAYERHHDDFQADPRGYCGATFGPDFAGVRPFPGTEYRLATQLVDAVVSLVAHDINESRYVLAQDAIQEAIKAGRGLERPRSMALLLAGRISLSDYIWPGVVTPPPP